MNRMERIVFTLSIVIALGLGIVPTSGAMHIMEGYLSLTHCVVWGALCLPFLVLSFISIKKLVQSHPEALSLLAMVGAFVFVLSALKIPSVTGSSSHPTGTGLGAVLFGASPMALLGIIVLLFQAILLAHGGLSTLGANTFSMAIAGPILTYIIYHGLLKLKVKKSVAVFLGVALGNLFTYVVTSIQLAVMHPAETGGFMTSATKFLSVFAVTQIPLAVIEGFLSVVVIMALEKFAKPELKSIGYIGGNQ